MSENETDELEQEIVVTAHRLSQGGGGGPDWFGSNWDHNWYSGLNFNSDPLAYLLGVDNIIFADVAPDDPATEPRPTVDEFIDTITVFLSNGFIGSFSATANYDEIGRATDATLTLFNFDDHSLDVYFFSRESEFYANVPREADDLSPIPNERYIGPAWTDHPLL